MLVVEVSQFVGQHRLNLVTIEFIEQRIKEDNTLITSKATKIGITMARPFRAIHDKDTTGVEAATAHEHFDSFDQLAIIQGGKLIKYWRDKSGVGPHH